MENFEIVDFKSLDQSTRNVIELAADARSRSYSPYSHFSVGSAILTEDTDKVYAGANVENAALSPSICAERAAASKAIFDGSRRFKAVAVVAHQERSFTAPCGVCRQTLCEFRSSGGDLQVYLAKPSLDRVLRTSLSQLLPLAFVSYTEDSLP